MIAAGSGLEQFGGLNQLGSLALRGGKNVSELVLHVRGAVEAAGGSVSCR